jgi:RNA methyltransferase, TrmH family
MKRIASRDNPLFKALKKLASDASSRRAGGLVLLEGAHLAAAYLHAGGVPRQIVVSEGALARAEIVALCERLGDVGVTVFDDALFAAVSQLPSAAGILLTIERPTPSPPVGLERSAVLLDRVQDPGNVGSILRTAAAAGLSDVFLSPGCAQAWSQKVLRAAMGAHFALDVHEDCDLAVLAFDRVTCIATSPHATDTIHSVDLSGNVAWLFGHEGQGIDGALLARATTVRIPQSGAIESLNVAAAAAICLFEQVRQRGGPLGNERT